MEQYMNKYWLDENKLLHDGINGKAKTVCGIDTNKMQYVSGQSIRQLHGFCKKCMKWSKTVSSEIELNRNHRKTI